MKKSVIVLFVFWFNYSVAQDSLKVVTASKSNPIVFLETFLGYAGGSSEGFVGNVSINYQRNKDLLTFRTIELTRLRYDGNVLIFPVYTEVESINEYAMLYGKRYISENFSYSFSGGASIINRKYFSERVEGINYFNYQDGFGFPFEFSIKWFNSQKERYRIYCIVPVGKPTSFSRSIGFKLIGNVSKTTFVGLGISYGFGWHKKY
jgi:hypothetical protein